MDDDIKTFISFTEREGFDINQELESYLYPEFYTIMDNPEFSPVNHYSYLELCCYHGSVKCFMFLREEFKSKVNYNCLKFSFLSGNADIINECMKYYDGFGNSMRYAIISHNIDFITYLMNEKQFGCYFAQSTITSKHFWSI